MFGMKDRERALYERLLEEKEKQLIILASEVDWHRAQSGTFIPHPSSAAPPTEDPDDPVAQLLSSFENVGHMSEDEEEIAYQVRQGMLDPEVAAQAIAAAQGLQALPFDLADDQP